MSYRDTFFLSTYAWNFKMGLPKPHLRTTLHLSEIFIIIFKSLYQYTCAPSGFLQFSYIYYNNQRVLFFFSFLIDNSRNLKSIWRFGSFCWREEYESTFGAFEWFSAQVTENVSAAKSDRVCSKSFSCTCKFESFEILLKPLYYWN